MGAILQPTEAMRPYRVEVRRQSFYLNRDDVVGAKVRGRYELCVPAAEAPAILAALGQVFDHPQWTRWPDYDDNPIDTSWTLPPGGEGPAAEADWSVALEGDMLTIRGPWVVGDERGGWAEISYEDAQALAGALEPFAA